jgi:hypothetical protein
MDTQNGLYELFLVDMNGLVSSRDRCHQFDLRSIIVSLSFMLVPAFKRLTIVVIDLMVADK